MKIEKNFNLKAHNTFKMNVKCSLFAQFDDVEELFELSTQYLAKEKYYILGGGSNTLFTDDFEGIVVHPNNKGIEILEENAEFVFLRVAAGVDWDDLIEYCVARKYYGLENLTAIPGLVGSSPVQNIGAYGVEVKDAIAKVQGFDISRRSVFELSNDECRFDYRNSIFKSDKDKNLLITHVVFRLSKRECFNLTYRGLQEKMLRDNLDMTIANISKAVREIRNEKLPDCQKIGNGGSFFKNPIVSKEKYEDLLTMYPDLVAFDAAEGKKLSAGQLIEKSGWKGKRKGDAGVYPKQALVLVNYGEATPKEILSLADEIIGDVRKLFDVELVKEINCI